MILPTPGAPPNKCSRFSGSPPRRISSSPTTPVGETPSLSGFIVVNAPAAFAPVMPPPGVSEKWIHRLLPVDRGQITEFQAHVTPTQTGEAARDPAAPSAALPAMALRKPFPLGTKSREVEQKATTIPAKLRSLGFGTASVQRPVGPRLKDRKTSGITGPRCIRTVPLCAVLLRGNSEGERSCRRPWPMRRTEVYPMARDALAATLSPVMQTLNSSFPEAQRVRRKTAASVNETIAKRTRGNVRAQALRSQPELSRRVADLEQEWDVERTLETNASTLALTGALLGLAVNKTWFWLTGGVLGFLIQHAASGWCPPLPILRRLGVRTQGEIDQEKYALKAIRGDFSTGAGERPPLDSTLRAVTTTESAAHAEREPDPVRRYTPREQLRRIDAKMEQRVRLYAAQPPATITRRIAELQNEWSIERYLQINVALVGISTAALAATKDRRWGIATCVGLSFFLFHAVEGFDPPVPALRKMGIRTRAEIDREMYALKILRGDFDDVSATDDPALRVDTALPAVGL